LVFLTRVRNSNSSLLIFYYKSSSHYQYSFNDEDNKYILTRKKIIVNDKGKIEEKYDIIQYSGIKEEILNLDLNELAIFPSYTGVDDSYKEDIKFHVKYYFERFNEDKIDKRINKIELNNIDFKNYYKLYSKIDFLHELIGVLQYNNITQLWTNIDFCGLIIHKKDYCESHSDFGSKNSQFYIFANPSYFGFKKDRIFSINLHPMDGPIEWRDKVKDLGEEIYKYYFGNSEFLLINFDKIELTWPNVVHTSPVGHKFEDKIYYFPKQLQQQTFVVSNQIKSILQNHSTMRNKKRDHFKPYENPTYTDIFINHQKIKVTISRDERNLFKLYFTYKDITYYLELPQTTNKNHLYNADDFNFQGIELNLLDREHLAKMTNRILDYLFD